MESNGDFAYPSFYILYIMTPLVKNKQQQISNK